MKAIELSSDAKDVLTEMGRLSRAGWLKGIGHEELALWLGWTSTSRVHLAIIELRELGLVDGQTDPLPS